MKTYGRLVVFEGIDGVGKTTCCRALCAALRRRGVRAVYYERDIERPHEGYNAFKPFIKASASTNESLLFYLASSIHKSEVITNLLQRQWVICDRYLYSTLGYHYVRGAQQRLVASGRTVPVLVPDYAFLLTLPEAVRQRRLRERHGSKPFELVRKRPGTNLYRMERFLRSCPLTELDNSGSVAATVDKVLQLSGLGTDV